MLRITTEEEENFTRFRLEGRLIGDWVREFERCWICAKNTEPDRRFRIDLSNVGFVDDQGKTLLENMVSKGVELQADNLLMRAIIRTTIERAKMEHAKW